MQDNKLAVLIDRYFENNLTPNEKQELLDLLDKDTNQKQAEDFFKRLQAQAAVTDPVLSSKQKETILQNIFAAEENHEEVPIRHFAYKTYLPLISAAAILLMIFAGGLYMHNKSQSAKQVAKNTRKITPANHTHDKAILTLADGSTVSLDDAKAGIIAHQKGIVISKDENGQVIYQIPPVNSNLNLNVNYNTLTTPRGGQFQILLPDGTKVWLNAASSLRYPTAFVGKERKVELTGEGYFEVAKDKEHPFFVASGNQTVEVLGTHFNINTYTEESAFQTTLLEGSIRLTQLNTKQAVLLKPGEQCFNSDKELRVGKAIGEEAIAWKNGLFIFNNEPIESIMRKISRWYDVDVSYNPKVAASNFSGTISRFDNVTDVLDMLKLTGGIHFKIEGRRIVVMP